MRYLYCPNCKRTHQHDATRQHTRTGRAMYLYTCLHCGLTGRRTTVNGHPRK